MVNEFDEEAVYARRIKAAINLYKARCPSINAWASPYAALALKKWNAAKTTYQTRLIIYRHDLCPADNGASKWVRFHYGLWNSNRYFAWKSCNDHLQAEHARLSRGMSEIKEYELAIAGMMLYRQWYSHIGKISVAFGTTITWRQTQSMSPYYAYICLLQYWGRPYEAAFLEQRSASGEPCIGVENIRREARGNITKWQS